MSQQVALGEGIVHFESAKPRVLADSVAWQAAHALTWDVPLNGFLGLELYIDVESLTGTSIVFETHYLDPNNGDEVDLGLDTAAISSGGKDRLIIGPYVATAANKALNTIAPSTLRFKTSGTLTVATISLAYRRYS